MTVDDRGLPRAVTTKIPGEWSVCSVYSGFWVVVQPSGRVVAWVGIWGVHNADTHGHGRKPLSHKVKDERMDVIASNT